MKKIVMALGAASLGLTLAACQPEQISAEKKQTQQTAAMQADAEARIGLPSISNYTEMQLVNTIMELRDQPNLTTFTYTRNLDGRLVCVGRSIGFGVPYALGRTNPERKAFARSGSMTTIPQAEPNGMYTNGVTTSATWVVLVGSDGQPKVTYEESPLAVFLEEQTGPRVAVGC